MSTATRQRSPAPHSSSPRPIARLRADGFDPTGSALLRLDPLAGTIPERPSRPPTPTPLAAANAATPTLPADAVRELDARAAAHAGLLRHTLESAIRLERSLAECATSVGQRLDQGARFTRELDRRLIAAGSAVGVLERATAALAGLESVLQSLRAAHDDQRAWIESRLDEQRRHFEALLEAQRIRLEQRAADIERSAAAASARIAVTTDQARESLAELEAESNRVGAAARERLERACDSAAALLGHDPRRADGSRPASGSLADAVARAEAATEHAAEAALRLSALAERAAQADSALNQSIEQARAFEQSQADLRRAVEQRADEEARLAALRDDLESVAASARYNLSQVNQAEASLLRAAEHAASRTERLERAMLDATDQARALVQVARDVGGLIQQADQARRGLHPQLTPPSAAA
ncbi:MAG: hypothetical protein ACK4WH_10580 [Phycisphaerales bacterium]